MNDDSDDGFNPMCPGLEHLEACIGGYLDHAAGALVETHPGSCVACQGRVSQFKRDQELGERCNDRGICKDSTVDLDPGAESPVPDHLGSAMGAFRILRETGHGGIGVVYEAELAYAKRILAVKVIRRSLSSAFALRRFEVEAHALGRLQHPGVAHMFEAGVADASALEPAVKRGANRARSSWTFAGTDEG